MSSSANVKPVAHPVIVEPSDTANWPGNPVPPVIADTNGAVLTPRQLRKKDILRERQALIDRTERAIDALHAEHARRLPCERSTSLGAAYARYSTRFQDSIVDQLRKILEEAEKRGIHVPRSSIFYDAAVRGVKNKRPGLDMLDLHLRGKHVQALLLFSTSRLFRKTYRTLAFVDGVHRGLQIRCIFVKSGVDTNEKERWEHLLGVHSLIDQFVVTANVSNIRAAHEGLLAERIVFGTVSYGYGGEPISGKVTKRNLPQRRIVIEPETAAVVANVFRWFVEDRLSVNQVIRRLNSDSSIPLPPKCTTGQWSRLAVLNILRNSRYRGLWKYGVKESVFLPEQDYTRQFERDEPLKEVQVEELRIVSDALWHSAQSRLARHINQGGRRPKDGDSGTRPRILNGLLVCAEHQQRLYVGGKHGRSMFCKVCQHLPASDRPLFTMLNRQLALKCTCDALVTLLHADQALVQDVIAACQLEAENVQSPDPKRLDALKREQEKITKAILFTSRHPGEAEEDQVESAKVLKEMRGQRAVLAAEIAQWESACSHPIRVPTEKEVLGLLENLTAILIAAANGHSEEAMVEAHEIIDLLTGGKIELVQQGERRAKRGWLQGHVHVRLLPFLVTRTAGVSKASVEDNQELIINYKPLKKFDMDAETAWQMYKLGKRRLDIGEALKCGRSYVTQLLKHAARVHGEVLPDGRSHRAGLSTNPPLYVRIAEDVGRLNDQQILLGEIANQMSVNIATVAKSLAYLRAQAGQEALDGRTRRKSLERKSRNRNQNNSNNG